mgnify:CR=1 FL=1
MQINMVKLEENSGYSARLQVVISRYRPVAKSAYCSAGDVKQICQNTKKKNERAARIEKKRHMQSVLNCFSLLNMQIWDVVYAP